MSGPYSVPQTPGQIRALYLLTLAQMLRCEQIGLYLHEAPPRQQAMKALDEGDTYVSRDDLIRRLRIAAHASVGLEIAAPQQAPSPYEPSEAVLHHAAKASATLRRLTDPSEAS